VRARRKGTGTIEATSDGRFRARFRVLPGERSEVGTFEQHADAVAALDAVLHELAKDGRPRGRTVAEACERCLVLRARQGYRGVRDEQNRFAAYVQTADFGAIALAELTAGEVRRWLANLSARGLAVQTQRNALNLIRAAIRLAVDDGWVAANVSDGIRVKSHGRSDDTSTYLTVDEADRLLTVSQSPEIAIALCTGIRSGEQRALRWEDVSAGAIVVRYGAPGKPTKSGKVRTVPLLGAAASALGVSRTGLVFPSPGGLPRPKGRMVAPTDWRRWLREAGITRRVRWHDLRHTCATLLLAGAWGRTWTHAEVQALLGHSSVRVTERYARNLPGVLSAAANAHHKAQEPEISPGATAPDAPLQLAKPLVLPSKTSEVEMGIEPTYDGFANRVDFNDSVYLGAIAGRLRALAQTYLAAVAARDPFAHAMGVDLATAVLADAAIHIASRDAG
jgi:integrase